MSLSINGTIVNSPATWDDLQFPLTQTKVGANLLPEFDYVKHGMIFLHGEADQIAYMIVQFPHNRKNGSPIRPHVHFVQSTVGTPVFKIDYRWYENGENPNGDFTTLTATTFAFTYLGTGDILQIATFPEINGSAINTLSSMMDIRLYRDDAVDLGEVVGKEFDIHYQIDGDGSDQEFTKSF